MRQGLLHKLIEECGYPRGCLSVEKSLHQLPHLKGQQVPNRRADIIAFCPTDTGLEPFLLIECKAVPLTPAVLRQVTGYNTYVQARFVAVANQQEVYTGWFVTEEQTYRFAKGLPPWSEALKPVIPANDP